MADDVKKVKEDQLDAVDGGASPSNVRCPRCGSGHIDMWRIDSYGGIEVHHYTCMDCRCEFSIP